MICKEFLRYLDEEIEKAPQDVQMGLKEVIGSVVMKTVLFKRNFIPTLWELEQKIPQKLFCEALSVYHKARSRMRAVRT